ncbi:MAG: DUF1801 domain-containing protein [Candidatus Paceibacterota bacterium]
MNPKVDFYFNKAKKWQEELIELRKIVSSSGVVEELKWGVPCYTFEGNNILPIHAFKEYCTLLFTKGVLMKDPKGILIQQTVNVQSGRQIRFTSLKEIVKMKTTIKAYIKEAVVVEKSGEKVEKKKLSEYKVPEEFQKILNSMPPLKTAFKSLTPGRQRAYLLYFAAPKQSKTRIARVEKYIDTRLDGIGLDD